MAFICLRDKTSVILKTNFTKTYQRDVMLWHED